LHRDTSQNERGNPLAVFEAHIAALEEAEVRGRLDRSADAARYGLARGTRYFFRARSVTKAGVGNWSQVLSWFVA
jgi:hypothetical protein